MEDTGEDGALCMYKSVDKTESPEQQEQSAQPHERRVTYDALVLDAKLRQSLMTVRSLGRRGMRVAAMEVSSLMEKSKHVPAFSSQWCRGAYVAPAYGQQTEPFLNYLIQFLHNSGARTLISSSDGTVAVLREHRAKIEQQGTRVALAKEAALAIAISKDRTLEVAERLGVGIPRSVMVKSVSDVAEAIREIGLPAVLKPTESWVWGGQQGVRLICKLVTTPDEARRAVEKLTRYGGSLLYQQFLSGRQESVSLLYAHGEVQARFAQWTLRAQPPLGGVSTYRQSIEMPEDTGSQAERLVREIELEGYSQVQFRRDSAGKPYLMEINPRLTSGIEVAVRAGVDFPYMVYQWANDERIDRVQGYRPGVRMRYLEGDLLTTLQTFGQWGRPGVTLPPKAVLEFLGTFFVPTGYDYFDWEDPHPALTAAGEFWDRVRKRMVKLSSF
jgi:predicted ATP-grasp superfamily ATP-dependent carboligase